MPGFVSLLVVAVGITLVVPPAAHAQYTFGDNYFSSLATIRIPV